jgi:hypothetical protein
VNLAWKRHLALTLAVALFTVTALPQILHAEDGAAAPEASTTEIQRCVSKHESARQLRLNESWLEARAAMTECAADECPLAIGADCRAWLEELSRTLPTLLILIERDPRGASVAAHVELDDHPVELPDPPVPIELLPGAHRLRVMFPGHLAISRNFSLEKAEKNHLERFPFPAPPPAPRLPVQTPAAPNLARTSPPTRPIPTATYLFAGGSLVGFGAATGFLLSALRERSEARGICAPTCDSSVRRSIETRLAFADASGGAGLVLGALAIYSFVRRPIVRSGVQVMGPFFLAGADSMKLTWQGQF